jgi:hypothetical protein
VSTDLSPARLNSTRSVRLIFKVEYDGANVAHAASSTNTSEFLHWSDFGDILDPFSVSRDVLAEWACKVPPVFDTQGRSSEKAVISANVTSANVTSPSAPPVPSRQETFEILFYIALVFVIVLVVVLIVTKCKAERRFSGGAPSPLPSLRAVTGSTGSLLVDEHRA